MSEGILGNATGGFGFPKTYILTDENGNELTGVYVESETIFTATDNDVREGMVYAGDSGVSVGTKNISSYRTDQGVHMVFDGDDFVLDQLIDYDRYDYTQLQCIIAPFDSEAINSVASDRIVLNNHVYLTNSIEPLSVVSKDIENKRINLNITNNSGKDYVIHYFTYKEEN